MTISLEKGPWPAIPGSFPFVRGVGISGLAIKRIFADEHADIDYFIITRANRLWIARTLMHFFKKLNFLIGRQDWYCMNYYVDEDALEINERNIFTATELITLVPVCGNGVLEDFFDDNGWATGYLPNYDLKKAMNMRPTNPRSWLKNLIERLLDNRLGDMLDNYLLSLTTRRWTKKAGNGALTKKGDPMRLQTGKHIARPDPSLLQARILTQYNDKMKGLAAKWPGSFYATRDDDSNPRYSSRAIWLLHDPHFCTTSGKQQDNALAKCSIYEGGIDCTQSLEPHHLERIPKTVGYMRRENNTQHLK